MIAVTQRARRRPRPPPPRHPQPNEASTAASLARDPPPTPRRLVCHTDHTDSAIVLRSEAAASLSAKKVSLGHSRQTGGPRCRYRLSVAGPSLSDDDNCLSLSGGAQRSSASATSKQPITAALGRRSDGRLGPRLRGECDRQPGLPPATKRSNVRSLWTRCWSTPNRVMPRCWPHPQGWSHVVGAGVVATFGDGQPPRGRLLPGPSATKEQVTRSRRRA